LYSVAVSPDDSNTLYTAGNEGIIKVWKIPRVEDVNPYGDTEEVSQNIGLMILNNEVIWDMKHHPCSNLLVSLSSDYNVNLWKTTNESEYLQWMTGSFLYNVEEKYNKGLIRTISRKTETFSHGPNPTSCSFLSSDTNQLAIGFNDSIISVYDIVKEKFSLNIKTHNLNKTINYNNSKEIYSFSHQQPNCITTNSTIPVIYSGFEDGSIKSIDLRNNGKFILI
jgi:WD40 repeat protein